MPTVKETEQILDYISQNPGSIKSNAAKQKLGISDSAVSSWKAIRENPNHPKAAQVKNKIFDQISTSMPAKQEPGGTGFVDRFVVKNLIDRDPDLQEKYLQKKGYDTRIVDGELQAKTKDQVQFSAVDPEGFDRFDVFDVFGDALEAVVTGVASGAKAIGLVGAPATGGAALAAGSALGGAATAGFEAAKQGVAQAVGAREDFDVSRITQAGIMGATIPGVTKAAGGALKAVGKGLGFGMGKAVKLKPDATAIKEAAEEIGAKATPGQLFDSPLVQKLESSLQQSAGKLGGIGLRAQTQANQKAAREAGELIVKDASRKTAFEVGQEAEEKILNTLEKRLAPAEEIYKKYEDLFKNTKFDKKSILNQIESIKNNFKGDEKVLSALKSQKNIVDNIDNISALKSFRSRLGQRARGISEDPVTKKALMELYDATTNARTDALLDAASKQGGGVFEAAQREIKIADGLYKEVANDVKEALADRGSRIVGSPRSIAKRFFEKTPEVNRINKILKTNDPKKIAAIEKTFPEAFNVLRAGKIDEIMERSLSKGEISPRKLTNIINKMPKETQLLVFGKNAIKKADALKTYLDNLPDKLGPSGTPEGLEFFGLFNILKQATSFGRQGLMDTLTNSQLGKDIFAKVGSSLQAPGTVAGAAFGARQFMPPTKDEFNTPDREFNFGITGR